MDLLISSSEVRTKLSEREIITTDFDEMTPSIRKSTKSFSGRNGKLFFGGDYDVKKINYSGYLTAINQSNYEDKRNWLYQLLGRSSPYYITPIFSNETQFDYEQPGQSNGNVFGQTNGIESNKRFLVTLADTFAPQFVGSVDEKQIYKLDIKFETAVLPFGESKITSITVEDKIPYTGTVQASQLEVPFVITIKAKESANGIDLTIGKRTWKYSGVVKESDVFELGGVFNTLNMLSINEYTNAEYFILEPSLKGYVDVKCSIQSEITIDNYKELYL